MFRKQSSLRGLATLAIRSRPTAARLVGQRLNRLTVGGDWALGLPAKARANLSWFWYDGFFAAASDNIVGTYLSLFILALGASRAQIGLLSSLTNLSAALMLLPGAMLVERLGHRKGITLFGGGWARLVLLLLALTPLVFGGPALIYVAIGLAVTRDAFNNLAFPAWVSITGDMVPLEGRGRFFASRNFAMGLSGMAVTLLAGELITHTGQPGGYQMALTAAFAFGMLSTFCFSRLRDPKPAPVHHTAAAPAMSGLFRDLFTQRGFLALMGTTALWNFSLNVAGPFFNVYMVQNLHASASMVALTSIASIISALLVQRKLGALSDRWGARRLQLVSGLLIPILPFAWSFVTSAWQVIPINLMSGVLWAGYNLASFNFLLEQIPEAARARYSALYQIIVLGSFAVGAAVGGLMVTAWGYHVIFIGSGVGRLAAALLFARFVRASQPGADLASSAPPA